MIQSTPGIQALLYADDLVIWATSSEISALELHSIGFWKNVYHGQAKMSLWLTQTSRSMNYSLFPPANIPRPLGAE